MRGSRIPMAEKKARRKVYFTLDVNSKRARPIVSQIGMITVKYMMFSCGYTVPLCRRSRLGRRFGQHDIEGPAVLRPAPPPIQQLPGLTRGAEDVVVLAKFMDNAHLADMKQHIADGKTLPAGQMS